MEEILSTADLQKLMVEASPSFGKELILREAHFSKIDLSRQEIPVSLDLDDAVIDGDFNLTAADFKGRYISLNRAKIGGSISLNGLKTTSYKNTEGIGLYLSGATIHGIVRLEYTKISTLVIAGARFLIGTARSGSRGFIQLTGTKIERLFLTE